MIIAETTMVVTTDNSYEHEKAKAILLKAGYAVQDDPNFPNRFTATFTQSLDSL